MYHTSAHLCAYLSLLYYQDKVLLDHSLSINPFVGKSEDPSPGEYHLCAVVHHIGNTAFSGHYTACAKRTLPQEQDPFIAECNANLSDGDQWVLFDDQVGLRKDVDYVTRNEGNQRNCYMALYVVEGATEADEESSDETTEGTLARREEHFL